MANGFDQFDKRASGGFSRGFPGRGGHLPQGQDSRLPPHSLEAERSVLGAILVTNDTIDQIRDHGIEPVDFYLDAHAKIFEAITALHQRREPIDLVTLSATLRDLGWFDAIGGTETLTGLFDEGFATGNASHYAKIVRDKAIQRRMIQVCTEIMSEAFQGVPDTESFLDSSESKVFAIANAKPKQSFADIRSILMSNMSMIEELALRKEDVTGIATGFHDIDRVTSGFHGGQTIVVAARPGMGKTSWLVSAIQHVSVENEGVTAFFSLEMSKEELGFRFLSGLSRIDSKRLRVGRLNDRDWQKLAEAADRLSRARIFIDDTGGLGVMDVRARCRRLMAQEKKISLIVIDYLQLMSGSKASRAEGSREREISEISRGLKELAKELRVPIIALSQLNRGVETRQDKRPTLADLRESGAIEQDADMVCFIHREDYYNKETDLKGIAEFIIAKNRAGETTTVKLAWLGQYTLFANLAPDGGAGGGGPQIQPPRPEKGDIIL